MENNALQDQIEGMEERLRLAMLGADTAALDTLISPALLFTTHMGQVIGKDQDLDMHRSGTLKFQAIAASERQIVADPQLAVVSVRVLLTGTWGGAPFALDLHCTRIWRAQDNHGGWQLVAGHSSLA